MPFFPIINALENRILLEQRGREARAWSIDCKGYRYNHTLVTLQGQRNGHVAGLTLYVRCSSITDYSDHIGKYHRQGCTTTCLLLRVRRVIRKLSMWTGVLGRPRSDPDYAWSRHVVQIPWRSVQMMFESTTPDTVPKRFPLLQRSILNEVRAEIRLQLAL